MVSFAVRLPREGRLGRETLGSEGVWMPDEADDAAAAAAAETMTPVTSRGTQHHMDGKLKVLQPPVTGAPCRIRQQMIALYLES